ncbi:protein kinase domain-containing protein [Sphaerisporangium viridialbum]|uniref:serine/threonine-protein kinase n=1 Tax=Sphaerisporangium viridialbum TaxID=46189 RepID=UPI003C749026
MPQVEPLREGDPAAVGPYRLVGRLGAGGQGVVYLGEAGDGRPVAVKVLREDVAGDDRFAKEIAAARRVEPFCIAQVLDASLTGRPYIVTEYIEGPSLQQASRHAGADLQRLAVATATALAAIHAAGVVHRDFKPANVLLGAGGPRVIDFGIARTTDAAATVTSAVIGTPAYMAPEQIAGQQVGPATDVFAWASVVGYAATGTPPFGNDTVPAIMNRILHNEPQLGDLPQPLRSVVYSCLAKDPRERPTMRDVLLRLLGGQGPTPPRQAPVGPRQMPVGPRQMPMGPRHAPSRRPVNVPLIAGAAAAMALTLVATVVWLVPSTWLLPSTWLAPSQENLAAQGGADSGTPTIAAPTTGSATPSTRAPQRPKRSPKPAPTQTPISTPKSTPSSERTTTRPTPTPTRTTKKPVSSAALRILSIRPQGKVGSADCVEGPANFSTRVESDKRSVEFSYTLVVDGKNVERGSLWVTDYTAFVPSLQYDLGPGPHAVTFRITSPVVRAKAVSFTVCPLDSE